VSAHLVRAEAKPGAAKPKAKPKPAEQADGGVATFKTDPNAPIHIQADQLDLNDAAKVAVFRGNVTADQGGFIINCAELHAYYQGEAGLADVTKTGGQKAKTELTRIEAKKNVFISSSEGRTASGESAEFNAKTNVITMGGEVVLAQGDNMVRGTRLHIDMSTGETKIDTAPPKTAAQPSGGGWVTQAPDGSAGAQNSGRASAVFFPQQLKAAVPKDAVKPPPAASGGAAATIDGWSATGTP
jgi:lipopolysaccharide transport protein LptA